MEESIFDIETDGISATRIHCLSATKGSQIKTTFNYATMRDYFSKSKVIIGHNIVRYDIPTVERLLSFKVEARVVDTLALSWYLFPDRPLHGLASWGETLGFDKPVVDDWENLSKGEYAHRCESDVEINRRLWDKCWKYLLKLYGSEEKAWRLIDYLTYKMQCGAEQERVKWKVDVKLLKDSLLEMEQERDEKILTLSEVMPKVPRYMSRKRPAHPYKQNGELSVAGFKWMKLMGEQGLMPDYQGVVQELVGYKEPNPSSHVQIKNWLFSLGWEPANFSYNRNKETNEIKKIPQIKNDKGDGICESIQRLYDKEPSLVVLDGLSVLNHRIALLKGILNGTDEEGYTKAEIQGLTNTLRFKHKTVVNLPSVDRPYGSIVRGCLIAPDGFELVGSDMSGLEDRTKQHYMWEYDPDYVREMMTPDFDPHLDLGVVAGMLSLENVLQYKEGVEGVVKKFKPVRHDAKQVNYSCTYGVTPEGLVRNTGMPLSRATKLHKTFWKRNWSIQAIADACIVKTVNKCKWLYNPVSELWYSLRYEKDRFSTLNQGTGVWCFDTWMRNVSEGGPDCCGQFHDEGIWVIRKGLREKATKHIKEAMRKTNEELGLNRDLDCDIQFGSNYGSIH